MGSTDIVDKRTMQAKTNGLILEPFAGSQCGRTKIAKTSPFLVHICMLTNFTNIFLFDFINKVSTSNVLTNQIG